MPTHLDALLDKVGSEDLYDFLEAGRGASLEVLKQKAQARYTAANNTNRVGPESEARKDLAGICLKTFRSAESREQYDRALQRAAEAGHRSERGQPTDRDPQRAQRFDEEAVMRRSCWELVTQGRVDEAKVLAKALAGIDPEDARLRTRIGELLIERQEYVEAMKFISWCADEDPENRKYKALMGSAHARLGNDLWTHFQGTRYATSLEQIAEARRCLDTAVAYAEQSGGRDYDLNEDISVLRANLDLFTQMGLERTPLITAVAILAGIFGLMGLADGLVLTGFYWLAGGTLYCISCMEPQWQLNAQFVRGGTHLGWGPAVVAVPFVMLLLPFVTAWNLWRNWWPNYKDQGGARAAIAGLKVSVRRMLPVLAAGGVLLAALIVLGVGTQIMPALSRLAEPFTGSRGGSGPESRPAAEAYDGVPVTGRAAEDAGERAAAGTSGSADAPTSPTATADSAAALERSLALTPAQKRAIQRGLAAEGLEPGPPDGVFGSRTREAIRLWQDGAGPAPTGYLTRLEAERLGAAGSAVVAAGPSDAAGGRPVLAGTEGNAAPVVEPPATPFEGHAARENERSAPAATGTLAVTTNATGAVVRIGGREHPLPGPELELPAGTHEVEVSAAGYAPFKARVDVPRGQSASLDVRLEREVSLAVARSLFEAGNYEAAAGATRALLQVEAGSAPAHLLLGRALYALDLFEDSIEPLRHAIALGERVELDARHRHGVGNFRQDYCRGVLAFEGGEVTFRSEEDRSHDFLVAADRITDVEIVESIDGQPFRLAARVQDSGSQRRLVEFVHRNVVRQVRSGNSRYSAVLACSDCDGSLGVQAALMRGGG